MSEKTAEQIAAEDAARLKAELDEAKKQAEDAAKRAEDAERKFEQTKKERSEEREKRQREAEKNQQYEEAKKLADEKLAEMQAEIEKLKPQLTEMETLKAEAAKWTEYQANQRKRLLDLIPEDKRGAYEHAPLETLETTVELLGHDKGGAHRGAAGGRPPATGAVKWSEMSDAERAEKAKLLSVAELTTLIAKG